MALQDTATLWNQLENSFLVSQTGPNGSITGAPGFSPIKFNNGITGIDNANYPTFAAAHPTGVSMVEFWWKPFYAHTSATINDVYRTVNGASDRIYVLHNAAVYRLGIFVFDAGVRRVQYRYNSVTWNANDLIHILIVIDSSAGNTNRAKLYMNGALQTPTTYSDDASFTLTTAMDVTISNMSVGRPVNGGLDNIKIYNSALFLADAIANRENEGWPSSGAKRLIDGGIRSNMIDGLLMAA